MSTVYRPKLDHLLDDRPQELTGEVTPSGPEPTHQQHLMLAALGLLFAALLVVTARNWDFWSEYLFPQSAGSEMVADGTASDYAGSLEEYRALVLTQGRNAEEPEKRQTRRGERRNAAEAREKVQPLRAEVKRADAEVTRLTVRKREIEQTLLDPKVYSSGATPGLGELMKEKSRVEAALTEAEARWLEASEALERAEAKT